MPPPGPGRSGLRAGALLLAAVLGYGGVVHIVQLATGGWPPYAWAPPWLAAYFTALTVADFAVAALLVAGRRAGFVAAAIVLGTDAAANWYATYVLLEPTIAARVAHAVITALALAATALAWRAQTKGH